MKVLLVSGSPRKQGNTELLLSEISTEVTAAGHGCELLRLAKLDIAPCHACGGCERTGRCVIRDDMDQVYQALETADRLVLGTPVYFYAVSAQLKLMIDRFQSLWTGRYLLGWQPRLERSAWLVSVGATRGARLFEGVELTCRYAADAAGLSWGGSLLVSGRDKRGAVAEHPQDLEQARDLARAILA